MYKCLCGYVFKKKYHFMNHQEYCDDVKQKKYLEKFEKINFDNIEFINGIPKVVFVCWFSGYNIEYNKMSINRFEAFKSLVTNIGVPVILISNKNYKYFIKNSNPIHKAFELLSGNHKSDYMRAYLLNIYGGGYHDIKYRKDSWENCWDDWLYDDNIWIYGRKEGTRRNIGYPPGQIHIRQYYNKLITMGWVISKPNTIFIKKLLDKIEKILDEKYDNLIKNPGYNSGGYYYNNPFQMAEENNYPLRWLELMGEISHPLMLEFTEHIKYGLPDALKKKKYM
jgi:hypothetical protein